MTNITSTSKIRRSLAVAAVATVGILGVANTSAFAAPKVAAKTTKMKHATTKMHKTTKTKAATAVTVAAKTPIAATPVAPAAH